jgi:hypothetical protein
MSEADQVLKALASLRPQIERMEDRRKGLYEQQQALYLAGERAGLIATEMARAMRPVGNIEHLAESIRQVLRKARVENGKKKTKVKPKT